MTQAALPPSGAARRRDGDLRRLRYASAFEGTTLLLLVLVAVPLKHLAGLPAGVRIMGPAHGLAFTFYVWSVIEAAAAGALGQRDVARLLLAALVPLGSFANLGWLRGRGIDGRAAS